MAAMRFYNFELDENCYRVRLVLSMLAIAVETVAVDMVPGREHLSDAMLALNPNGELPILVDGDLVLSGPMAIMSYLAKRHGGSAMLPPDPVEYGQVQMWLEFAATQLRSAHQARLIRLFGFVGDDAAAVSAAGAALRVMDDHMTRRGFTGADWFVGDGPTLADIALFPAFALSRDFGIGHEAFPALRLWGRRVRTLPGFKTMPGIPDYH